MRQYAQPEGSGDHEKRTEANRRNEASNWQKEKNKQLKGHSNSLVHLTPPSLYLFLHILSVALVEAVEPLLDKHLPAYLPQHYHLNKLSSDLATLGIYYVYVHETIRLAS